MSTALRLCAMETSSALVSSESVLVQVVHSNSTNNLQAVEQASLENVKTPPTVEQQSLSTNFSQMMWEKLRLSDANVSTNSLSYAMGSVWSAMTNEEKELFQSDKVPSEEILERCSKQILTLVSEQQVHQGSLNESSTGNIDSSSLGNMLQTDTSAWQEAADDSSLEPGECTSKLVGSENQPNVLNLDHIEGQVLLGVGLPEWGEVLQKDDEARLLEMNFMSSDAEKRMLRATIIERSKEINRLQRELHTVFQIIHQLKQENEYLTRQQQFSHSQALTRSNVQAIADVQQTAVQQPDKQNDLASNDPQQQQQEFVSIPSSEQNDQILLLELLNNIPAPPPEVQ